MTTIHLPPGEAGHHSVIDGDHVAKAAIPSRPFEDGAGRFLVDLARSVPPNQPVEESIRDILSVLQHHGAHLAGT